MPDHMVLGTPMNGELDGTRSLMVGMGCFWGAERIFWQRRGVKRTAAGYAGGEVDRPSYREVCSGSTGHAEVVKVDFDPARVSLEELLRIFWEGHDPTQRDRQGNDVGTQYRSALYLQSEDDLLIARRAAETFQQALLEQGYGPIATEMRVGVPFFMAEQYHQQYLAKNPDGYCGLGGTGVACPVPLDDRS